MYQLMGYAENIAFVCLKGPLQQKVNGKGIYHLSPQPNPWSEFKSLSFK
jgi:hypothetical protein